MTFRILGVLTATTCMLLLAAGECLAQGNAGQEDLDAALEAKIDAQNVSDFGEVITLLDAAIEKGLNEENLAFAENMLASTLIQRGIGISQVIFNLDVRNVQQLRQFPAYRAQALADLERAVSIDDNQPRAHLTIGRLHALPGGTRFKAQQGFEKAIALAGDENEIAVEAYVSRATIQEDEEKRLADYAAAIDLRPDMPEPYRARGQYYIQAGKFDEGLADLAQAIENDPDDLPTLEAQIVALGQADRLDDALSAADKLVDAAPESASALLLRARVHGEKDNYEAALADADAALTIDENNINALLTRVQYLQNLDRYDDALQQIEAAIEKAPTSLILIRNRGLIYARQENFPKAIEDFQVVRDRAPNDLTSRIQLATVYNAVNDYAKARDEFDAALKIDPESVLGYQGRADAYLHLGNQIAARDDYERALEINADNTSALNNLAWLLATSPNDDIRDGSRAIELANHACELTEFKQAHILSTLAAAYAETGDFDNARKYSQQAIDVAGETGDQALVEPLGKELASYEQDKPWREALPGQPAE